MFRRMSVTMVTRRPFDLVIASPNRVTAALVTRAAMRPERALCQIQPDRVSAVRPAEVNSASVRRGEADTH